MRIQGLAVVGALGVALLTGCTSSEPYAFVREEMSSDDVIPDDILEQIEIDVETVRFQGEYQGVDVFLALSADDARGRQGVQIVVIGDGRDDWTAGGSDRDSRVAVSGLGGLEAAYWPGGLDEPSDGWTLLSEWVEVRG